MNPHAHWHVLPEQTCCNEEQFIHETACIDDPVTIGHGTQVMHFSHIMANAFIGSHCHIGHNVMIASGVFIGNHVRVMNNTCLNTGVIIEDHVFLGPSTVFTPLKYIRGQADNVSSIQPTLIKRGASIGANTTIASGFTIGQFAFVESGAVIDSHIPDFALVYGNPVQFAGWRCECGNTLRFTIADTTQCARCGKKYARKAETEIIPLTPEGRPHDSYIQPRSPIQPAQRLD